MDPRKDLHRRATRFGLSTLRGVTPEFDKNKPSETNTNLSLLNNLKRSTELNRDDKVPWHGKSENKTREEAKPSLKEPHVSGPVEYKANAVSNTTIQNPFPWEKLTKHYSLNLEDSVIIASRKPSRKDGFFVAIREFSGSDINRKISMLKRINKEKVPNFLKFLELFSFERSHYVVFEHEIKNGEKTETFPVTLNYYALIEKNTTTESQLVIILKEMSLLWLFGNILTAKTDP
jgi:hypothetical protein